MLPPKEAVEQDIEVLTKLVATSRALATVNANIQRLPNPHMLINTIALQEAKTSTEIENIFTTNDELYKAVSDKKQLEASNPSIKEVIRYREALWAGYQEIQQSGTINIDSIIKIFQQVKDSSAGIRPPQAQVVIRRGESEFRSGEIIYTPPRKAGLIEDLLNNLVEYLNDDEKYKIDPLLKMCIAHYQFEAIHPFQDGNGRTGRILNLLFLVHKGLLTQPILYLSRYIIVHKDDYYYKLGAVTQLSKWKSWVMFMLEAVERTSNLTNRLINEILQQMEATLIHGKQHIKWYNKEVNEIIFSQPYIKPNVLGALLSKTSRTTLTKYMNELVQARILSTKKDGLEVYYLNDDLLRILEQ
ncbi:MAG: Fic family protein [Flammeovirgaceae bacterium]